jgi:hypothetical protein
MKVILFGQSIRHSGAHAPLRERTRNPEPWLSVWIPGPREDACPGMTGFTDLFAFIEE